jgi:predicted nucleic acid-binding protein
MTPQQAVRYVIDANVAVKLFVNEPLSDKAHELFFLLAEHPGSCFYVPGFFYAECANVLWKYVKRKEIGEERAHECLRELLTLPLAQVTTRSVAQSALWLALEHDIAAYDAAYLATAERVHAPLVSDDEPLMRKLRGKEPLVLSISEALARSG